MFWTKIKKYEKKNFFCIDDVSLVFTLSED